MFYFCFWGCANSLLRSLIHRLVRIWRQRKDDWTWYWILFGLRLVLFRWFWLGSILWRVKNILFKKYNYCWISGNLRRNESKGRDVPMLRWKEKISLRNLSSANIAALCWCGTIVIGNIIVLACNKVNFRTLPENCAASAVLFLIQSATAIILGECYDKTGSSLHRKILIVLGVLHGGFRRIHLLFQ